MRNELRLLGSPQGLLQGNTAQYRGSPPYPELPDYTLAHPSKFQHARGQMVTYNHHIDEMNYRIFNASHLKRRTPGLVYAGHLRPSLHNPYPTHNSASPTDYALAGLTSYQGSPFHPNGHPQGSDAYGYGLYIT